MIPAQSCGRAVQFTSDSAGHVAHITVKDEPATPGPRIVKDLYLAYGTNEKVGVADSSEPEAPAPGPDAGYRAPALQEWQYDPNHPREPNHPTWPWPGTADPFDHNVNDPNQTDKVTAAIEFRYESGRQRYLLRYWDTHDSTTTYGVWTVEDATWTDYLGDEPYVDYTAALENNQVVAQEQMRWLAGLGTGGRRRGCGLRRSRRRAALPPTRCDGRTPRAAPLVVPTKNFLGQKASFS